MERVKLFLRWSWRDLRARWLQVVAIALVIGIGSGAYSALASVAEWREISYDASYESLNMWDLHVELAEDETADAQALEAAAIQIDDSGSVEAAEARLVLPTQVDVVSGDQDIVVAGQVVGMDVSQGDPAIAQVKAMEGRSLNPDDDGEMVAVVDEHFADHYGLPADGTLKITGGSELQWVGRGLSPEHFMIVPPRGTILGESGYAVLWAPLSTVQAIAGEPDQANSLVVTVTATADRDRVEQQLTEALEAELPDTGFTVAHREDHPSLRYLYQDIDGDRRFNAVFALIILAGAALAAFNLTGRVVDAQRREIGIGMALGASPLWLAIRPLLVSVQIALAGVVAGVLVGLAIDAALASVLESVMPMPIWNTGFQLGMFAQGAALGLLIPVAASLLPIVHAVRVPPVDAIRTAHTPSASRRTALLKRAVPGSAMVKLPFRNVLRTPRRTFVTALAIGAAISTLVGVVGMIDTYQGTIDASEREVVGDAPDRLLIDVEPNLVESAEVQEVLESPVLQEAEAAMVLQGALDPAGNDIDVYLFVTDLGSDLWRPSVEWVDGGDVVSGTAEPGLVLSQKALDDLGLGVGDPVPVRHPRRVGAGIEFEQTELPVVGVHGDPFRFMAYVDRSHADIFGMAGVTNLIQAIPSADVTVADVQRQLGSQPGVISVQLARQQVEAIRDQIEEFMGFFTVVQIAVLILALLVAFSSSSINLDERRREHATMFAFGIRLRTVIGGNVTESMLVGMMGTLLGLVAGRMLVSLLTTHLLADTLPEIGVTPLVSTTTTLTALVLGTVAVVVAPLLASRRLRDMDIPSTLRVVE